MDHFNYRDGELFAEGVPLREIAQSVGTPCYVYSRATLERHWRVFDQAFGDYPHLICYAVKANGNLAVLNVLARLGSGFDIVSGGELERVLRAGGVASKVIFSGVGKQEWELRRALEANVRCFNIESAQELERINVLALEMGRVAPVSVRINPDVDANTHPYIATGLKHNKFGISIERAIDVYREAVELPGVRISGVACHIGSQLTDIAPFDDALERVLQFIERLAGEGIAIDHIDFGGGLGIRYENETPPEPAEYWNTLHARLLRHGCELPFSIEPGRAIAGNAGILLTRVEYLKQGEASSFCIVDAAMNDLIRPALYQARQEIMPVDINQPRETGVYDVVGPICETGDFLGKDRELEVAAGDLLAVRSAGAYGAVMASNYNARRRPAEVMVDGERFQVVRERETVEDLFTGESMLEG